MSTFALVHGAWHGAWCWNRLAAELRARGHDAVALDLPSDDPEAGVSDYAGAVLDSLGEVRDEVVVVGHSLGGLTAPVVAASRPTKALVMLCAVMPEPGRSLSEQYAEESMDVPTEFYGAAVARDDGTSVLPADVAEKWLYHDCDPRLAREAAEHLRPQGWRFLTEPSPLKEWPEVPSRYVVCADDRVVPPEWSRRVVRSRLGGDPLELPGSHSPMLSRPAQLADLLV